MARAVFLDRDGVIAQEKSFILEKKELELLANSAEAIKLLNQNNYLVIVISNQSAVARALASKEKIDEIWQHLHFLLNNQGARIDKVYYCPHHPDPKKGKLPEYTKECDCRKPKPGMIFQAQKEYNIEDLSQCFLIGDQTTDIKSGITAGCKTILVETGYGGSDKKIEIRPHFTEKDLYNAVTNIILRQKN